MQNTTLDKDISNLALQGCSFHKIAVSLEDTQEYNDYCAFLFTGGLHKHLFKYLIGRLKKNLPIPWGYLFILIKKYQLDISTDLVTQVFLKGDHESSFLAVSHCLESSELLNLRTEHLNQQYRKDPQLNIEEELQIAKSQRLTKKEGKLIQDLIQLDDKNPLFQQRQKEYQYTQAKDVFNEYKNAHQNLMYTIRNQTSPEEDKILKNLVKGLNQLAKKHPPALINDMIIILSSTGYTHLAIEFLEDHLNTDGRQWIYLDLLLEDKQYLKCLNFIEQTFLQTHPNSDTAFSLNYAKAQAYYGLKEYEKAKTIMNNLVSLRPQYRSAKALLSQWKLEEEL
ncbi:MAG: hypothetical protein OXK80_06795 [Bdellovibrionales bacterium]|nr:hypothetical protein [Bdellovibrionales bacterium]